MKQLVQNIKKSLLTVEELPVPICKRGGVLVRTLYSAVSVGTEIMKLKNADLNYLQMAKKKPEQVKEVINTLQQQGVGATYRKVMNKLDSFSPLGYSLVGEVIEVGENVSSLKNGDIVACAGAGYANHAEINYVPVNLCAKVPEGVDFKEAAFTTIASIALQGFRRTNAQIGENLAVIGLGLLGQILIQIIQANGSRAFGFDISAQRCEMAVKNGATHAVPNDSVEFEERIKSFTGGLGCDSVIITTGTSSNDPVVLAGKIARDKAAIVDIGITKMDLPWELYYHKELDFRFSRSYGPGRYDPMYEEQGMDYPPGYVRWTEQRNMQAVLQLLHEKKLNISGLITHEFGFSEVAKVFPEIKKNSGEYLGVLLKYEHENSSLINKVIIDEGKKKKKENVILGLIGAGNYASTMLIPFLKGKAFFKGVATATGINAKDKAVKFGFGYATTDYKELLKDPEINTVLIATRHNQHAKMVTEALYAGKHVYVEKPLAISEEEVYKVFKAYTENKNILMVGYNRRYSPSIRYLRKQLVKNYPYSIYYQVNAGYIPPENWYQSPEQGGRIIGEVCHFIDTLQYLLNADPVEVYASSSRVEGMPAQDNTYITIGFDNGSVCVIAYLADGDKKYSKEKILITGQQSNWEFDNFKSIIGYTNGGKIKKHFPVIDKGQRMEMETLTTAIKTGSMPIPIRSLIINTLTTILAVKSIHTGEKYRVNLKNI